MSSTWGPHLLALLFVTHLTSITSVCRKLNSKCYHEIHFYLDIDKFQRWSCDHSQIFNRYFDNDSVVIHGRSKRLHCFKMECIHSHLLLKDSCCHNARYYYPLNRMCMFELNLMNENVKASMKLISRKNFSRILLYKV